MEQPLVTTFYKVLSPSEANYVDKILMQKRELVKETDRFKNYLHRKYNDLW